MPDYRIELANTDYIGRMNLVDIQADLHCFGTCYPSSGLGAEFLRQRIAHQEAFMAVSRDGELYGFAAFEILLEGNYCFLHQISVAPEQQRQGIGFSLLEEIFQNAKKKRVPRIGLVTTLSAPWGVNLYQKFGFHPCNLSQYEERLRSYLQDRLGKSPEDKGIFEIACEEKK